MASISSTRISEVGTRTVNGKGNTNASAKRKSMADIRDPNEDMERKKKKGVVKKQPAFNPRPPSGLNSSNTPPEDDDDDLPLPPPPSERKIGRRRESTRAIRERDHSLSPTPAVASQEEPSIYKKQKTGGKSTGGEKWRASSRGRSIEPVRAAQNTSDDPLAGVEETASMRATTTTGASGSATLVPAGESSSHRPPVSTGTQSQNTPPRRTFGSNAHKSNKTNMGPPTGFVRKTRQSMGTKAGGRYDTSQASVVPVLQSETPVIRKNQELRGQQARRSSLDHRGGRASSSWGRGEITIPHKSVDSKLFYQHIPVSYPDPIKARMLLVWCASRAVEQALKTTSSSRSRDKGKSKEKPKRREGTTEEGDKLIKDIMDEFVRDMNRGAVDTSVFSLPGQDTSAPGLRPHPRNVSNKKVEQETNAEIRKFKDEEYEWTKMITSTHTKQRDALRQLKKKQEERDVPPELSTSQGWMKDALSLTESVISQGDGDLSAVGDFEDVEYKVDTLLQSSHVALQYTLQSTRFLDGVFSSLTADLRSRDRFGLSSELPSHGVGHDGEGPDVVSILSAARLASTSRSNGPPGLEESSRAQSQAGPSTSGSGSGNEHAKRKKENTMSLLRALASVESKVQDEKTVERAMQIRPVTTSGIAAGAGASGGGSGGGGGGAGGLGVTATPRRMAATPRRGLSGQTPGK